MSLNNVVLEDSQPARCLIESGDVPFRYDYSIPRRLFIFDYNKRHVRLDLDVDSSFREIASMLEKVAMEGSVLKRRKSPVCAVLISASTTTANHWI